MAVKSKVKFVNLADIEYLIPHLKHEDIHLYEALTKLARISTVLINELPEENVPVLTGPAFFARGILPGVQAVANDVLSNRYHAKMPLRPDKTPVGKKIVLQATIITAKVKPATGDYISDVLVSRDKGLTFKSLYKTGNANKAVLKSGLQTMRIAGNFAVPELFDDDQLRVDVLQVDGTTSGIEILLQGVITN